MIKKYISASYRRQQEITNEDDPKFTSEQTHETQLHMFLEQMTNNQNNHLEKLK